MAHRRATRVAGGRTGTRAATGFHRSQIELECGLRQPARLDSFSRVLWRSLDHVWRDAMASQRNPGSVRNREPDDWSGGSYSLSADCGRDGGRGPTLRFLRGAALAHGVVRL